MVDLVSGHSDAELADISNFHRLIGDFTYMSGGANTLTYGRIGIIAVSADAFTAGAVPELIADFEAPWWYNQAYSYDDLGSGGVHRLVVDFKLNRRYYKGQALPFILDVNSLANGTTEWGFHCRILYSHK